LVGRSSNGQAGDKAFAHPWSFGRQKRRVRGRVSTYRLDHAQVDALTSRQWSSVGPDFEERMMAKPDDAGQGTVVPFPTQMSDHSDTRTEWGRARAALADADAARYQAWFAPLVRVCVEDGVLVLKAPSGFHARYVETHLIGELVRALTVTEADLHSVSVISD